MVGFRRSELAASHWGWQLQGSEGTVINRERWASWKALAHKLRSWVEAKGRGARQWGTWEQPSSCSPHQSWALAAGILNLKERIKLVFLLNKLRSLYCSPDHFAIWALWGLWMYLHSQNYLDGGMCSYPCFQLGGWGRSPADCKGLALAPCGMAHHLAQVQKRCCSPLLLVSHGLPCQEKEGCFGAGWQFWGLSMIWLKVLRAQAICCLQESASGLRFLLTARQRERFQLEMLGSRLWEADYSQSYLTLLENRVGFVPLQLSDLQNNNGVCQCESPARQRVWSLCVFACRTDMVRDMGEQTVPTSSHWNMPLC